MMNIYEHKDPFCPLPSIISPAVLEEAEVSVSFLLSGLASAAACCKSFSCCWDLWSLCSAWNNWTHIIHYWYSALASTTF